MTTLEGVTPQMIANRSAKGRLQGWGPLWPHVLPATTDIDCSVFISGNWVHHIEHPNSEIK